VDVSELPGRYGALSSDTPRVGLVSAPLIRGQHLRAALAATVALAVSLTASACGGSASSTTETTAGGRLSRPTDATLVLDFVPNAVHAGIYRALRAGYYREENLNLKIVQPSSTADTLKLLEAGKAQFGIADGIDLATQVVGGRDVEGIMALLERPAGGLITLKKEGITDPKELEGKTVGITGVPSDTAALDTIMADAGGDPAKAEVVTIGFAGAADLASGRIAAFTGFVPADGVQVEHSGHPVRSFLLDEWGGPAYPGLVVFSTRQRIEREPALMQAFVTATIRGYEDTFRDPRRSVEDLVAANPELDEGLAAASLHAYMPLFRGEASRYGLFQPRKIEELSEFMLRNELSEKPFAPSRYATNEFVEAAR
jgi:putative hydroxymethylpyrimidine transport system substrate-binding protein